MTIRAKILSIFTALSAAALLGGCAPAPTATDEAASAFSIAVRVAAAPGAQIVGSSADRRRVAFAWPCDPGASATPRLAMLDDWTGAIAQLGPVAHCAPTSVFFSPDGQLAAFPQADGVIAVWSARTGAVVTVSRPSMGGIAVAFSPDSRWLVVASTAEPPRSVLDAWDADLVHHVEAGANAFINPFAGGNDSVKFSPDGRRILFLGDAQTQFPLGTLISWERGAGGTSGRATALAHDVGAFIVSDDYRRVAYLDGVHVTDGPPSEWLHGRLAVERLGDGHVDVLERDAPAIPQLFLPDSTLVYVIGTIGGPPTDTILKVAAAGGAPVVVDHGIFQIWGPATTLSVGDGGHALAYVAAFDPMHFSGELRLARLPARGAAPVVVAGDAVPMAFGFVDRSLFYLHASTGSFPPLGELAAVSLDGGGPSAIASGVTQVQLRFDRTAGRVLYLDHWDENRAAGDLRRYSTLSGRSRLLVHDGFAMSLALSPDGERAGILALGPSPADGTPPRTTLELAPIDGPGGARTVARDVTSFAVGDGGRVLYTTNAGLYAAFTL
ncbi:MAG: WD40 repeat domain-containing protein [Polyangia bacterium]